METRRRNSALSWAGLLRIVLIGLMVCSVAGFTGCKSAIEKLNEALAANDGDLQRARAVTMADQELAKLDRIDVVLTVGTNDLNLLQPKLVADLNQAIQKQAENVTISKLTFVTDRQVLSAVVDFNVSYKGTTVEAQAILSTAIAPFANGLHVNAYLDEFKAKKIRGGLFRTRLETGAIAETIHALRGVFNIAIDQAINSNPANNILVTLDTPKLINLNLQELSDKNFKVDPRTVQIGMDVVASAVLIDKRGILVASRLEFVPPESIKIGKPKFPAADKLARMSDSEIAARIAGYQGQVEGLVAGQFGDEAPQVRCAGCTSFTVTREATSRLFNTFVKTGPVMGHLKVDTPSSGQTDLTLTISKKNCGEMLDACQFKNTCEGNRCENQVTETVHQVCQTACCLGTNYLGICIWHGLCSKTCDITRLVTKPISSPTCDAFRAASTVTGGALCSIASNLDKAVCDVVANVDKASCDVVNEVGRFYEKNPIATVKYDMRPDATVDLAVLDATMAPDLTGLSIHARATGKGNVAASLAYDKHNYAQDIVTAGLTLGATCAVDWKESVALDASADTGDMAMEFGVKSAPNKDGNLVMSFAQSNAKPIYIDFSPSPLKALFVDKPQVSLNCPLVALASVVMATGEAVFTEKEARKALPALTGEDYPLAVAPLKFDAQLPPLRICDPTKGKDCPKDVPVLKSRMLRTGIQYSAH